MSQASTPPYRCSPIASLAAQLSAAATPRRRDVLRRAEALHDQIDPDTAYPFEFIAFRLTGFRRDYGVDALLIGAALRPDLRTLIDALSKTLDLPPADGDSLTADALALKLNVSTKTLARWRKDGLRWRWITPMPGARRVIGFTADAVDHFTRQHEQRVARAATFTQLSAEDRRHLLERARRLAAASDATFNRVAAHLARRSGRALETIRLLLEKHDRDHPESPLFADRTGPLTARQKRLISRAYRMGIGVGKLSARFRRSRATIYRTILDRRAAVARRLRLAYVPHAQFDLPEAEAVYMRAGLVPPRGTSPLSAVPVDALPEPLRPLYIQPVISPDKIRSLFLRYNFLKHRAVQARHRFDHAPARATDLEAFEHDVSRAARVRSLLVAWHLPVVLSVARRHLVGQPDPNASRLVALLELGNPVLIEAVEAYDAAARPTFESVLTNRLLRAFAEIPQSRRAQRRTSAAEVVQRMINLADESGVHLAIGEEPPPPEEPTKPRASE